MTLARRTLLLGAGGAVLAGCAAPDVMRYAGARPTLRYSLEGSATLRGGYRMPFSRTGELGDTGR